MGEFDITRGLRSERERVCVCVCWSEAAFRVRTCRRGGRGVDDGTDDAMRSGVGTACAGKVNEEEKKAYGPAKTTKQLRLVGSSSRLVVARGRKHTGNRKRGEVGPNSCLAFGQARSEFLFKIKFRDKQGSLRIEEKGGVDRWRVVVRKRGNRCLE